jgi:hypothetical protein
MMALRAHARGGPEQLVYEQPPPPAAFESGGQARGPGKTVLVVR